MLLLVSVVALASLLFGASAQSSCGLGSMEPVAPQTMTFVLSTITATVTKTSIETTTTTATVTANFIVVL